MTIHFRKGIFDGYLFVECLYNVGESEIQGAWRRVCDFERILNYY